MKLHRLRTQIEEPIGDTGLSIIITDVALGNNNLPVARVTVWSRDSIVAGDRIQPDSAADRRRLASSVVKAPQSVAADRTEIEQAILRCAEALHQMDFNAETVSDE